MVFFKSKDKLSIFQRQQETKLFEFVMDEIANNNRQKGLWGQAIVKSNGDEKKAEAEYIKLRVESLKDELEIQKQNEDEQAILQAELNRIAEEEKQKNAQKRAQEEQRIKIEKENKELDGFTTKYLIALVVVILLGFFIVGVGIFE
jgi:hypothetical protein